MLYTKECPQTDDVFWRASRRHECRRDGRTSLFSLFLLYYAKFNEFWHRFIGLRLGRPQFIAFEYAKINSNQVHVKMLAFYGDNNDKSPLDNNVIIFID